MFNTYFIEVRSFLGAFVLLVSLTNCGNPLPDEVQEAYSVLPDKIDYNFHVKPILSDRCYTCHGPDEQARKANLRLDIEDEAFKALATGNRAFVKGSISSSAAIHRMVSDDPAFRMPPEESGLAMNSEEIAIIAKWLDQGAEWKAHWSFIPVQNSPIPEIPNEWARINPVDNFIQAKLIEEQLAPAVQADKERLLRRVTMDLTGLPPTMKEINDFVADNSDEAYEKVVDRLLESDGYAERMAMDWMDIARYADSHGISFDGSRTSWPYRDWLINSFKTNIAYDEFITNQVAGDLIENTTDNSRLATAFYRMNPLEGSAGSIPEEFRIEYISERTGVTGTAFLGLTLECARCHDHKFDPISQKEFYQVSAFFNTTEEYGLAPVDSDRPPTMILLDDKEKYELDSMIQALIAEEGQYEEIMEKAKPGDFGSIKIDEEELLKSRIAYYGFESIKTIKKEIKKSKEDKGEKEYEDIQILDNNKKAEAKMGVTLTEGKKGKAVLFDGEYSIIELREVGEFEHVDPFSISTWIETYKDSIGTSQTIIGNSGDVLAFHRGWELALDSTNHVKVRLIHRLPDEVIEVRSTNVVKANVWNQVGLTYDGSKHAKGVAIYINGEKVAMNIHHDNVRQSIVPVNYTEKQDTIPLQVGKSYRLWMEDLGMFNGAIDEISIFDRQLSQLEMAHLGEINLQSVTDKIKAEHLALHDPTSIQLNKKIKTKRTQIGALLDSAEEIMVMKEMANPRKTYLLERGLYNQHGEEVEPGGIQSVLEFSDDLPKNRLGLAQWLTDPANPLVARVAINRYWQMIFGAGLVSTSEDFGSQGSRPTHPELLDWLAINFIDNGWDIRSSLKLMVMSATYRQTSYTDPDKRAKDPQNVYLSRGSSYRWPAEIIRDNILASSGLLVKKIGGPSVKPYQPEGLWKEVGGGTEALSVYKRDSLDNLYRRSLYTFTRRFAPNPFMANFDATSREICTIRRDVTSSPLQALTLLNDPQVIEASRMLSEKVQTEVPDSSAEQLKYAFRLSTSLSPTEQQLAILDEHYRLTLLKFQENPAMADSLLSIGDKPWNHEFEKEKTAALAIVASTIFNFDEAYMKR